MSDTNRQRKDPQAPSSAPRPQQNIRLILWAALLTSLLMYGGIGYVLQGARQHPQSDALPLMIQVLSGVAVLITGMIFLLPRLLGDAPQANRDLVRWALAESIGLFGLVLSMLGATHTVLFGFIGWAVVLLVALFPRNQQ